MANLDKILIYGNVAIQCSYCRACDRESFVLDGRFQCCNAQTVIAPTMYQRESAVQYKRRLISPRDKRAILTAQRNRCFYCERLFGTLIHKKGKFIRLQINYDHFVPFVFSGDNRLSNIVAACHICNGMKEALCFDSVNEARIYLQEEWRKLLIDE